MPQTKNFLGWPPWHEGFTTTHPKEGRPLGIFGLVHLWLPRVWHFENTIVQNIHNSLPRPLSQLERKLCDILSAIWRNIYHQLRIKVEWSWEKNSYYSVWRSTTSNIKELRKVEGGTPWQEKFTPIHPLEWLPDHLWNFWPCPPIVGQFENMFALDIAISWVLFGVIFITRF